jgi:DNA-directed RNA polymerase I subunit RPA2
MGAQGRKRGGGIRFGEMERDALLAHGTSFLLQDRLLNCSDYSTAWVCRTCGSLISVGYDDRDVGARIGTDNRVLHGDMGPGGEYCRVCRQDEGPLAAWAEGESQRREPEGYKAFKVAAKGEALATRQRMDIIAFPFVLRFLLAELAAMGIKMSLTCRTTR